jgi:hypothetical protein
LEKENTIVPKSLKNNMLRSMVRKRMLVILNKNIMKRLKVRKNNN